jgi:hypothetical protein
MLSSFHEEFFFSFAVCLVVIDALVFFLMPETKGRTLECMDEIFWDPYRDLVKVELGDYRRGRGLGGAGKGEVLEEWQVGKDSEGEVRDRVVVE